MRPSGTLAKLELSTDYRLEKLRKVAGVLAVPMSREVDLRVSYVTINVLNTWSNFVRAFYLSCLTSCKSVSGSRVSTGLQIKDFDDGIYQAVRLIRPKAPLPISGVVKRRDEPAWHDPDTLLRLAAAFAFSNKVTIDAAISLQPATFKELTVFRNYFAHRNDTTSAVAMRIGTKYGIVGQRTPCGVLVCKPVGRPQALLMEWIDDIIATVQLMCL